MQVLLSAPRAGSSYAYEKFHRHNLLLPNVEYIGVEEYLDPNQFPNMTLQNKINFLETQRSAGIEYTFKHHINYLGTLYESWFVDFYKRDDVYILKRRDKWRWFLSFLFQDSVQWKLAHFENQKFSVKSIWKDYDYTCTLVQFFDILAQLERCNGTVIYYEDLSHRGIKNQKLSDKIKYEKYFDNIDVIEKEFKKWQ